MYRFSLEWSRIEPEEGAFSRAALQHYRRMLAACQEHGLTAMVTFHHFTSPRWLMTSGGWEGQDTPDKFARYCERAAGYLGDLIGAACTLNEANISRLLSYGGSPSRPRRCRSIPIGLRRSCWQHRPGPQTRSWPPIAGASRPSRPARVTSRLD
jgi:beta-glucosidase